MESAIKIVEEQIGISKDLGTHRLPTELLIWKQVYALAVENKERAETLESMACDARMSAVRTVEEVRARIGFIKEKLGIVDEESV